MTPAEWNSGGAWGTMTADMYADNGRLAAFVAGIPLARLDPSPLEVASPDPLLRGWGVAGADGGLFWVQDLTLQGRPIEEIRAEQTVRTGTRVELRGLAGGTYTVTPYDTWQGVYLDAFQVVCVDGNPCLLSLPDFTADMAFRLERER
jgi:hypothetical protein